MPWSVIARLGFLFVLVVTAYAWISAGGSLDVARYLRDFDSDRVAIAQEAPLIRDLGASDRRILEGLRQRAGEIALEVTYLRLQRAERDLESLQTIVDRDVIPADDRYTLQSLGVALGDVMVAELGLEWVVYEDETHASRALRVPGTDQLVFPVTMISKRVEREVPVDVRELFEKARELTEQRIGPRLGDTA